MSIPKDISAADAYRLPPYGGSGLKCLRFNSGKMAWWSPSIRREWIEILHGSMDERAEIVSLHTEGVD